MTEFKPGDIVRLTKGKRGEPGFVEQVKRVGPYTDHLRYESVVALTELPTFIRTYNWKIELVERPLPTSPNTLGWATWEGERRIVRRRNVFEVWDAYDCSGTRYVVASGSLSNFTEAVLIPKTLADKVMEWAGDEGGKWYAGGILERIAGHLKGQDNE